MVSTVPRPGRGSDRARLLRRLGRYKDSEEAWAALAAGRGTIGTLAWIEVAKLREHRLGDLAGAVEAATAALRLAERQAWLGRPLARIETALGRRLAWLASRVIRARTAPRSGTPARPGASTTSDAAAAANLVALRGEPTRAATSSAARNTSPAPVGSTVRSGGIAG